MISCGHYYWVWGTTQCITIFFFESINSNSSAALDIQTPFEVRYLNPQTSQKRMFVWEGIPNSHLPPHQVWLGPSFGMSRVECPPWYSSGFSDISRDEVWCFYVFCGLFRKDGRKKPTAKQRHQIERLTKTSDIWKVIKQRQRSGQLKYYSMLRRFNKKRRSWFIQLSICIYGWNVDPFKIIFQSSGYTWQNKKVHLYGFMVDFDWYSLICFGLLFLLVQMTYRSVFFQNVVSQRKISQVFWHNSASQRMFNFFLTKQNT